MARIAFVLADDFEDSEFRKPYDGLKQAGHEVVIFGVKAGETVKGKAGKESVTIERASSEADAAQFDALVIPGGYSPDHLRLDRPTVDFVAAMMDTRKLVAAVCHGPQLLIEADAVKGRTLTSYASVKLDLINAGGKWVDKEVVTDANLITSRTPADLPAFTKAILEGLQPAGARSSKDDANTRVTVH